MSFYTTELSNEFQNLSIHAEKDDAFDWGDENCETTPASTNSVNDQDKFRTMLKRLEKKVENEILVKSDSICNDVKNQVEKSSAVWFQNANKALRSSAAVLFSEANVRNASLAEEQTKRGVALKQETDRLRKVVAEMSFFNASLNQVNDLLKEVAHHQKKVTMWKETRWNSSPNSIFNVSSKVNEFVEKYPTSQIGSVEDKPRLTPAPLDEIDDEPPKKTPSPVELSRPVIREPVAPTRSNLPPRLAGTNFPPPLLNVTSEKPARTGFEKDYLIREPIQSARKEESTGLKRDDNTSKLAPKSQIKKLSVKTTGHSWDNISPPSTLVDSSRTMQKEEGNKASNLDYDSKTYSNMKMFTYIDKLSDERRSLCRPVGCTALPGTRMAAVVHSGSKVVILNSGAKIVRHYLLEDPDGGKRIQLVGDVTANDYGDVYLIDRDHLPSRIFVFQVDTESAASNNLLSVLPHVFCRFSGRIRIYGLAMSPSRRQVYTSTRTAIVTLDAATGEQIGIINLNNPNSAYVHSCFDGVSPYANDGFVVFTAKEGRAVHKKDIKANCILDSKTDLIASSTSSNQPISLVRRTGCDPVGNVLGADSGAKQIRVSSLEFFFPYKI